MSENTWTTRDPETGRHHRNGHLIELSGCMWRCLHCRHQFDAAADADLFWCGDNCTGKHYGDPTPTPEPNDVRRALGEDGASK